MKDSIRRRLDRLKRRRAPESDVCVMIYDAGTGDLCEFPPECLHARVQFWIPNNSRRRPSCPIYDGENPPLDELLRHLDDGTRPIPAVVLESLRAKRAARARQS